MKVIEVDDGKRPGFMFPVSAKINEIHDWLNRNYNGYKFCIVMDETKSEFEMFDHVFVEFLDDLGQEIAQDRDEVILSKRDYEKLKERAER